jgi:hypothetical protein
MSDADRDDVIESGTAPEIYVDGVADCWQRGSIARIRYFAWQKIGGLYQPDRRVIVLTLVQPAEALLTEREFIAQALRGPGDLSRTSH